MRLSSANISLPLLAIAATAAPTSKHAKGDIDILNFALTLEHFEAAFYAHAISKFNVQDFKATGLTEEDRNQVYSIGQDEKAHADFLSTALGKAAVAPCIYDFSALTDVKSFLTLAKVIENVGVMAYSGQAGAITNKAYLGAAASILTVEARHQTLINTVIAPHENAVPAPFDTAIASKKQIFSAAAPFFKSCPNDLGLKPFPKLAVTSADGKPIGPSIQRGLQIKVSYTRVLRRSMDGKDASTSKKYITIIDGPTPTYLPFPSDGLVTIPQTLSGGLIAVFVTNGKSVADGSVLAGPALLDVSVPVPSAP